MRRAEAVLLFLFITTAMVFFATRPGSDNSAPNTPLQAAATVAAAVPGAASAAPSTVPRAVATPVPEYLASSWLKLHPPTDAPPITAQSAIVVDRDTQQIVLEKDMHKRRPPASIMKIVTAMVALDSAQPSQLISISREAANEEPNKMGLSYGEQVSVQDLLYGLLLDSGNDAAEALAGGVPGGRTAFLRKMNDKAASFGLKDSHFVDASGLDDSSYSTPYDMAVLANAALTGYPLIRTVVSTKEIAIPGNAQHKWFRPINLNDLLWDYPGTYGVKVGYTDAAEYTIILAGQKNGRNVLIVLLASQHHFTEGRKLFDWAYAHLPVADGTPVKLFPTS